MSSLKDKYTETIKDMIYSTEIASDNIAEDEIKRCIDRFEYDESGNNHYLIGSEELKIETDEYILFILLKTDFVIDDVIKSISEKLYDNTMQNNSEYSSINLFFIFLELKDEYKFKVEINTKRVLIKKISMALKVASKTIPENGKDLLKAANFNYKCFVLGNADEKKNYIRISNRVRSLEYKNEVDIKDTNCKLEVNGYVFTAKLYDLYKLYNKLGSELFNKNVRFNIKDELEVDSNIKRTLKERPKDFWYLNNGISMVIEDDDFMLRKENVLELNHFKDKKVSIINGAQTISASAEFFLNYENEKHDNEMENPKEDAEVILKVINFTYKGEGVENKDKLIEATNTEIDKVSIGLNRQKPIKPEDVAYTMDFVYDINRLQEKNNDDIYFCINKRGAKSNFGISIVEFARIVKAYLAQDPGNARSNGAGKLLKIKVENGEQEFEAKDIFKPWVKDKMNKDGIDEEIFKKYYKPVNFANRLEKFYSKNMKEMKKEFSELVKKSSADKDTKLEYEKKEKILSYGKWYFIAYVIYEINEFKNGDFTNFEDPKESFDIKQTIMNFLDSFYDINSSKSDFDSNEFKNSNLYKEFCNHIDKNKNHISIINEAQEEAAATIVD